MKKECPLVVSYGTKRYNIEERNYRSGSISDEKGGVFMKIDMHCHVKEGSIDSKVGLGRIYYDSEETWISRAW